MYMELDLSNNISMSSDKKKEIKHIVISGGGIAGFSFYGALRESNKKQIWDIDNIESIHGTSVGAIIAVFIILNYEWDILDEYIIKRPWHHLYKFNMYSLLDSINTRGIFDAKIIEDTLKPLLLGKDMSINITMEELYQRTQIDLHVYVTEINNFEYIDVSYKTHPNWRLVDAVYASSCLPLLFSPLIVDGNCYCDGGLIRNYPLSHCIKNGANPDEILGLFRTQDKNRDSSINDESTLIDYGVMLITRIMGKILNPSEKIDIAVEYNIVSSAISLYSIIKIAASEEDRLKLIEEGAERVANDVVTTPTVTTPN